MGLFKKKNKNTTEAPTTSWTKTENTESGDTLKEISDKSLSVEHDKLDSPEWDDKEFDVKSNLKTKKKPFSTMLRNADVEEDFTDEEDKYQMPNDFTRPSVSENEESIFVSKAAKKINEKSMSSSDLLSEGIYDLQIKKVPIIGNWAVKSQYQLGIGIAAVGLVGLIAGIFVYSSASSQQNRAIQTASQLNSDLQKLDGYYTGSISGRAGSYDNLIKMNSEVQKDYANVKAFNQIFSSNASHDLHTVQSSIDSQINTVNKNILALKTQGEFLRSSDKVVADVSQTVTNLTQLVNKLGSAYGQTTATPAESYSFFALKANLQSINNEVTTLLLSNTVSPDTVTTLAKNRDDFKQALSQFYVGDAARGVNAVSASQNDAYTQLTTTWIHFSSEIDSIINNASLITKVKDLSPQTERAIASLDKNISTLQDLYASNDVAGLNIARLLLIISLVVLIASILVVFYIYNVERDNRSMLEKSEYSRNQASILKLLHEMMPLQDGDLTQKTTVTEEITGAIADSINATIDSLASLVKKIKDTSLVMRKKTNEVNNISVKMLESTEKQTVEITSTSNAVIAISHAINEISSQTESGAEVAINSVKMSEEGSQQVFASIEAMKVINEQMTETVHLMKKVSDSSKQIFEIVELLSDISEETAILALNATVQAAKAGEAGKGFKIVADGIQELADGAGDATRRVGALIAAVQTDIQAVGEAVQKTTSEVEKGVSLSELAGNSLNEMTEVSNHLAHIVNSISQDAKKHAIIANQVNENVAVILEVTKENKEATQKTATSISEIAQTANELGDSVQSFKVE